MPNSTKHLGASAESLFAGRALSKGLDVFIPCGDYLPQDAVVMNGAGSLFKVQVKSTRGVAREGDARRSRYKIQPVRGSGHKQPLDCSKVDVLACYIEDHDLFYLIPCLELMECKTIWLYALDAKSKGKFEIYKDYWDIFKSAKP